MQSADHIVVGSPSPRHSHKQQYNDDFLTGRNVGRYGVPPRNVLVFYVLLYSLHRPQILYDSGRRRWVGRFGAVRPGFKAGATELLQLTCHSLLTRVQPREEREGLMRSILHLQAPPDAKHTVDCAVAPGICVTYMYSAQVGRPYTASRPLSVRHATTSMLVVEKFQRHLSSLCAE